MKLHCAALLMQKEDNALKTLQSFSFIDTFVLLDTGISDADILRQWAVRENKILHIKKADFTNLTELTNNLLEFADSILKKEWVMLLENNNELVGNIESLDDILVKADLMKAKGISFKRIIKSNDKFAKSYVCKIIKTNTGWKCNRMNELEGSKKSLLLRADTVNSDAPHFYTDEMAQNIERDYKRLLKEVEQDETNSRNVFHLARHCEILKSLDEANKYYKLRVSQGGFYEEVFHSFMSLGMIHKYFGNKQTAVDYFLEAYEIDERVEPLLEIASIYIELKEWRKAFLFIDMSLTLKEPKVGEREFFVDFDKYSYQRYHLCGIVAYYVDEFDIGEVSCKKAISKSKTKEAKEMNQANLKFYINRKV